MVWMDVQECRSARAPESQTEEEGALRTSSLQDDVNRTAGGQVTNIVKAEVKERASFQG